MRVIYFLAAIFLSSIAFAESTIYEFYRPTDNGKALINPDMGWCAYFYSCRTATTDIFSNTQTRSNGFREYRSYI